MPYHCRIRTFSVKSGTAVESSRVSSRHRAIAIYLEAACLKGVTSMKLNRDLGVTQRTIRFTSHQIRESMLAEYRNPLEGPVEVDETYVDSSEKDKHSSNKLHAGRGTVGKVGNVDMDDYIAVMDAMF